MGDFGDRCWVDARIDAGGKDPDVASATLRRYHQLLWSKPLPNGTRFELSDTTPGIYLHHKSQLGEVWLSSDGVIPTFTRYASMARIVPQVPEGAERVVPAPRVNHRRVPALPG